MNVYLVRHGDAVAAAENVERALSALGRRQAAHAARAIVDHEAAAVARMYHSGILRARQTAEIIVQALKPAPVMESHSGLLPDDDPAIVAAELNHLTDSVALVGHLPYMRRLAGLLIYGDPDRTAVDFSPATVLCCSRFNESWKINWTSTPGA